MESVSSFNQASQPPAGPFLPPGNVNIIGFSLTGFGDTTSFGKLLEASLRQQGWNGIVRDISYGGLSIDAMAGLIETATAPVAPGDVVALEFATSFYSLHKRTLDEARPYVFSVVRHLAQRQDKHIFFLNLFRADLDDNDTVVQAIREAAAHYGVPILDLKASFRALSVDGQPFGTTDGIHPDPHGRQLIADAMLGYLTRQPLEPPVVRDHDGPTYEYMDLTPMHADREIFEYEGRGKSLRAVVVPAPGELVVDLGARRFVVGVCFLYGPETGYVAVRLDDGDEIELVTFDENSYYRRVGFRPIRQPGRRVTLRVPEKTRDKALLRPTNLKTGSRRDFIAGLVLRRT